MPRGTGALVTLVFAVCVVSSAQAGQPTLDRAAAILGIQASVVCMALPADRDGQADVEGRVAMIRPADCDVLLHPGRARQSLEFADALHLLAHELGHIELQTDDETAAECFAMAWWIRLGKQLGLSWPSRAQLFEVARTHEGWPAEYRAHAC